jgi:uncharacterized protein YjbI with pentapeptide repeats
MRARNLTPLLFGAKVTSRRPPQPEMTLVVRGAFRLRPGEPVALLDGSLAQGHMTAETFHDGDDERTGACLYPGDFADFKPNAEVMLRGSCHPPRGRATECSVRFALGGWSKTLQVFGDRVWSRDGAISAPRSFESMPIAWESAFGGPGFAANPVGKGHAGDWLPNVEHPAARIRRRDQRPAPASFGPINPLWPQRSGKTGKAYGEAYVAQRAPYYAEDFDWSYFHAAPADQQLRGFLRGDEDLVLENLHPAAAVFEARLPALRVRAFVNDVGGRFREVALVLDTLFADLDDEKLFLTWRGLDPVEEPDLCDVKTVLIASEPMAEAATSVDHYRGLLETFERDPLGLDERLPPELRGLARGGAPPERPRSMAELTRQLEDSGQLSGADGPAIRDGLAQLQRSAPPGDLDARLAQAARQPAPPPLVVAPVPGAQPHVPLQELVRTVRVEVAKLRQIAEARGIPFAGLDELEALSEDPRLREVDPSLAAAAPEPAAQPGPGGEPGPGASLAGRDLSKQDLSGRDLRGADLSGANLTGANLRDAKLAGAKLRYARLFEADIAGADLSGADLSGANFTRARGPDVDLRCALLDHAIFQEANLEGARLGAAHGELAVFNEARLTGASATRLELRRSFFQRANLERADFSEASLTHCLLLEVAAAGADFSRATLTRSSFADGMVDAARFTAASAEETRWLRTRLAGADLRGARLARSHFVESAAPDASFLGADLRETRFYRAALERVDARQANLFGADLSRAGARGARFGGASLYDAKLLGADVEGCDFTGAKLGRSTLERA